MSDSTTGLSIAVGSPGSVPELQQPSGMTCWATVATMMVSARESTSYPIEAVMDQAGEEYRQKFDADQGLAGTEKDAFLGSLRLQAEPPQCYAVDGLASLISSYGPVWVTTDEDPSEAFAVHARVIEAMEGDGTPDGTSLTIVDPGTGTRYQESFADCMRKLEEVAIGDMAGGGDFRIQVVHF
ncbi:MAG: papain-like cysteine protease family protein [Actinomycetota bacterium]